MVSRGWLALVTNKDYIFREFLNQLLNTAITKKQMI